MEKTLANGMPYATDKLGFGIYHFGQAETAVVTVTAIISHTTVMTEKCATIRKILII